MAILDKKPVTIQVAGEGRHELISHHAELEAKYLEFRRQQLALAAETILEWRKLSQQLTTVIGRILARWQQEPPECSPASLASLIRAMRELKSDWIGLCGIYLGQEPTAGATAGRPDLGEILSKVDIEQADKFIDQLETYIEAIGGEMVTVEATDDKLR
jgi:hypothetical protein